MNLIIIVFTIMHKISRVTKNVGYEYVLNTVINHLPIQRSIDENKVQSIINYQKYFSEITIMGTIMILETNINFNDTGNSSDVFNYIIDGQHRWEASKRLYNSGYNFGINIEIYYTNSYELVSYIYKGVNMSDKIPDEIINMFEINYHLISEKIINELKVKYSLSMFKTYKKKQRPFICEDYFKASLLKFLQLNKETNYQNVVNKLIQKNNKLIEQYTILGKCNEFVIRFGGSDCTKFIDLCNEYKLFLGLYCKYDLIFIDL